MFTAAPEILHPGEGTAILEPILGPNSVIRLDEDAHMTQRKLLLPAFHGERMRALSGLMIDVAERQVASWPRQHVLPLHPRLQALTLEIILRAVFGLEPGERLENLCDRLAAVHGSGESLSSALPDNVARVVVPAPPGISRSYATRWTPNCSR